MSGLAELVPKLAINTRRAADKSLESALGIGHSALLLNHVTPRRHADRVSARDPFDDPVPSGVVLSLDEAFRVLEAIEDARLALRERGAAPGLQDELATVIRMLHGKLGFDEGGVQ